jgi:AcrR family transcriptional regulator
MEAVAAILDAAVRFCGRKGAQRFITARVAERAGVSVGTLYQYFPNKAAILFRLQSDEWRQTSDLLGGILDDERIPPLDRLRSLVHAFIRSECDEAEIGVALNDAAPVYRDAPEAKEVRESGDRTVELFMQEPLSHPLADSRFATIPSQRFARLAEKWLVWHELKLPALDRAEIEIGSVPNPAAKGVAR